jgi:hypothetical protein
VQGFTNDEQVAQKGNHSEVALGVECGELAIVRHVGVGGVLRGVGPYTRSPGGATIRDSVRQPSGGGLWRGRSSGAEETTRPPHPSWKSPRHGGALMTLWCSLLSFATALLGQVSSASQDILMLFVLLMLVPAVALERRRWFGVATDQDGQ